MLNKKYLKLLVVLTKLSIYLFLILMANPLLANSYGQGLKDTKVSINVNKGSLVDVFKSIEDQSPFLFLYDNKVDNTQTNVSMNRNNMSLYNILQILSKEYRLKFKKINHSISVSKVPEPIQEIELPVVIEITGKVIDENGQPLPGASIIEKGTQNGTTTDFDGNFAITLQNEQALLTVSYLGYQTKEVSINNSGYLEIRLEPDAGQLSEVVVIGYGEVEKRNLTGSIARLSGESVKEVQTASLDYSLQGKLAGVNVTSNSSAPGGDVSIRIRGNNSILGGNEPLYVIDGFPIYSNNSLYSNGGVAQQPNALSTLNTNDIASIEVLKDAASTAIYGSRGANGVILITTKRGSYNSKSIDVESYLGVQEVAQKLDLLNAREFVTLSNEAYTNDGLEPLFEDPSEYGNGTDWQDEIFRTALIQNHQITFSGGGADTRFSVVGNLFQQDGVVLNSGFKRGSLRLNIDSKFLDFMDIGASVSISSSANNQSVTDTGEGGLFGGVLNYALTIPPTIDVRDANGNYNFNDLPSSPPVGNPVALATEPLNRITTHRILGNFYTKIDLAKDLSFKTSFGTDISDGIRDFYLPSTTRRAQSDNGQATIFRSRIISWLNENVLSYSLKKDKSNLDVVAGFTVQGQDFRQSSASSFNFISDEFRSFNLGAGANPQSPTSGRSKWTLLSYLGRLNYNFDDRYLFSVTGRADGSSKYGDGNKWGVFPSVAGAWRLTKEPFFRTHKISELKLRASFGVVGNQEIGEYQSLAALTNQNYVIGNQLVSGIGPSRIANPDLKWETTEQTNIGLDFGAFNDKLTITSDYYYKKTKDLLLLVTVPSVSGFSQALKNSGSLKNEGFEFAVNGVLSDKKLKISLGGNIFFNRNEVLSLGETGEFPSGAVVGSIGLNYSGVMREGLPIGNFNGYVYDGLFQSEAEVEAHGAQPSARPGDIRYRDLNNDGQINTSDLAIIGDAQPDFTYGINGNIAYGNWSMNFLLSGVSGIDVLNMNKFEMESLSGVSSQLRSTLNRWTSQNTNTNIPRASAASPDFRFSSRQLENGSYLRLRNITIGYDVPMDKIKGVKGLKFYLTGQNLFTITNYSGYDPEVNTFAGQDNLTLGIDYGTYPRAKTYILGMNIKL